MTRGAEALLRLFAALVEAVGVETATLLVGLIFLGFFLFRVYSDWRRDRWAERALDEKERTIQRVAKQEREWRIYFLVQMGGMTRDEAEKMISENVYGTPHEAREALEGRKRRKKKK